MNFDLVSFKFEQQDYETLIDNISSWEYLLTTSNRIESARKAFQNTKYQQYWKEVKQQVQFEGCSEVFTRNLVKYFLRRKEEAISQYVRTVNKSLNLSSNDERQIGNQLEKIITKYNWD